MGQPAVNHDELAFEDMSVGDVLRRTRLHYGQSLADVEGALRIRASQIEAIENDRIEQLPGRVYAIGFVRSYAEYLGLDGNKIIALFKRQSAGKVPQPELDFPIPASETKMPPLWLVVVSVVLGLAVMMTWLGTHPGPGLSINDVPEVPASLKVESPAGYSWKAEAYGPYLGENTRAALAQASQAAATEPEGIILDIVENSWVEITDQSGTRLVSQVLKAGDLYFVPDRPDLEMSLGNAGGVRIQVNGQALAPVGAGGEVRRNIPLDVSYLKQHYAPSGNQPTE